MLLKIKFIELNMEVVDLGVNFQMVMVTLLFLVKLTTPVRRGLARK